MDKVKKIINIVTNSKIWEALFWFYLVTLIILIVVLSSSCARDYDWLYELKDVAANEVEYGEVLVVVEEIWASSVAPISDRCDTEIWQIPIGEFTKFPKECEIGVDGCLIMRNNWNVKEIYIRSDASITTKKYAAAHIYIHALAACETGNADLDHTKLYWSKNSAGSIETKIIEEL